MFNKEKVTCEDVQEMALRQDSDYIESLKMLGEGTPNYPSPDKEKEDVLCKIEYK